MHGKEDYDIAIASINKALDIDTLKSTWVSIVKTYGEKPELVKAKDKRKEELNG
jgi:hypothetical protein